MMQQLHNLCREHKAFIILMTELQISSVWRWICVHLRVSWALAPKPWRVQKSCWSWPIRRSAPLGRTASLRFLLLPGKVFYWISVFEYMSIWHVSVVTTLTSSNVLCCVITTWWTQFCLRSVSFFFSFLPLYASPLQAAKDIKDRYGTQPSIASLFVTASCRVISSCSDACIQLWSHHTHSLDNKHCLNPSSSAPSVFMFPSVSSSLCPLLSVLLFRLAF